MNRQALEVFAGDKKKGKPLLDWVDCKLRNILLPLVPSWIQTYHLTLTTILWSALIIFSGFMARYSIAWLWLSSAAIFLQYLTDLLDGAVGRERNTGLIKWGYYMDHFLDYVFLCSILIGYSLLMQGQPSYLLFLILAVFGAFMVNSYLAFAATNEFKIAYLKIGPTEVRLVFIAINTLLIAFGKTYIAPALPYVLLAALIGLIIVVYRTQKYVWKLDMKAKK